MQSGWLEQFHRRVAAPKTEPETAAPPDAPADVSRRTFIQSGLATGVTAGMAAGGMLAQAQVAQAQAAGDTPIGPKWWPSTWGAAGRGGRAPTWITPAKVLRGGQAHQDRARSTSSAACTRRACRSSGTADLRAAASPARRPAGPFGKNKLVYHDEFVCTEIGQVGTQFDGLGHIGCIAGKDGDMTEMRFYNGFTEAEIGERLRPPEARHRERQAVLHPRRPGRRRRASRGAC